MSIKLEEIMNKSKAEAKPAESTARSGTKAGRRKAKSVIKTETYTGTDRREEGVTQLADRLAVSLESLSNTFSTGSKRVESIIYMAMFAFILLAAYGFFLIYTLTNDVGRVADNMNTISNNVGQLTTDMSSITKTMNTQSTYMYEMVYHIRSMNNSMGQIRYDMSIMNNSVTRPMNFMNSFIPW